LFLEIEKHGGSITESHRFKFTVRVAGEGLEVSCKERLEQIQIPLSAEERRWHSNAGQDTKTDHKLSGVLRLQIEDYFKQPIRRRWHDLPEKPLEKQLREIMLGLYVASAVARQSRLAHVEQQRQWAEAAQRRHEFEERKRLVDKHIHGLLNEADNWARSNRLRAYIKAMLDAVPHSDESRGDVDAWATWARLAADAMDPLAFEVDPDAIYEVPLPPSEVYSPCADDSI
jgi:hypothetical protein